jgi:WD40 repeat protein
MDSHKPPIKFKIIFVIKSFIVYLSLIAVDCNAAPSNPASAQMPQNDPRLVLEAGGHTAVINSLIFTDDGSELVSIGDDKTIRVWSVSADGRKAGLVRTIRGQIEDGRAGEVFAAALSPPDTGGHQRWFAVGGYLAGSPEDRDAVRLHEFVSGEVRALLRGHTDNVLALAISPSGRWLASAGKDCTVRLWDLTALQGERLTKSPLVLKGHTDRITDVAWSPSGDRLASASYDGTVGLWNTSKIAQDKVELVKRLKGHSGKARSVAFHPDGSVLASGGQDGKIRLWQTGDGKSKGVLADAGQQLSALNFSPDGRLLVTGNFTPPRPKHITLFTYPAGKTHLRFKGHDNLVVATAFHPSGRWLASGGGDNKPILFWSVDSGKILSRLEGIGRTIEAVAFSKDGRFISWGQTYRFSSINDRGPLEHRFDLKELEYQKEGLSRSDAVWAQTSMGDVSLEVKKDGDSVLSVLKGRKRHAIIKRGAKDGYWHSAYTLTPDGRSILSGGQNGELRFYGLEGKPGARLIGHTGQIKAVAVSADGRWALSGANDQTVKLWNLAGIDPSGTAEIAPALTLFPTADNEWIAWTPEGYFAASANGARQIGYSVNQGVARTAKYVSVDQLYDRFYRPDLVYTKLHGDPERLWQQKEATKDVEEVISGGLAPRVTFVRPTANAAVDEEVIDVQANVMDQGGGIGKVVWKINDTTVATDSHAEGSVPRLAGTSQTPAPSTVVTLKQRFTLLPGANTVELVAFNRHNEIASVPAALTLTVKPPPQVAAFPSAPPQPPVSSEPKGPSPAPKSPSPAAESPAAVAQTKVPQPSTSPPATSAPSFATKPGTESTAATPAGPTVQSLAVRPPPEPEVTAPSVMPPPPVVAKVEPPPVPTPALPSQSTSTAAPSAPPTAKKMAASMAPRLHLLVVGINRYRDKALQLKYAVQDGQAIVDSVRRTGEPLFQKVTVTRLFDDQVTIKGLEQAFREVQKAINQQDVFMLYLAGHGVTLDGRYYFLPHDFRYYNDEAVRTNAVNQDHLQDWLADIPARKSLVLIDTCESGSFSQSMVAMRGMAEKAAIAKLTRATGRATIVASTDEQPAAEGYQGHGVFTYVLLQGLRHADAQYGNRDGYTGLFELAAYVNDQVPTITMSAFNFEQIPQVHMVGTDFPIGVVEGSDSST